MQGVGGLLSWSGKPQRLPSFGAEGSLACSPQSRDLQLRNQNLAVHAIFCQYAAYDTSKSLFFEPRTWKHGEVFSSSVQFGAQTLTPPTAACVACVAAGLLFVYPLETASESSDTSASRPSVASSCRAQSPSRKIFFKIRSLLDAKRTAAGHYLCAMVEA